MNYYDAFDKATGRHIGCVKADDEEKAIQKIFEKFGIAHSFVRVEFKEKA